MPPRAQRLYPRMRERPPEFLLNRSHSLANGLIFAWIPDYASHIYLPDRMFRHIPYQYSVASGTRLMYSASLGRWSFYFAPNTYVSYRDWSAITPVQQITLACWIMRTRTATREFVMGKGDAQAPGTSDYFFEITSGDLVRLGLAFPGNTVSAYSSSTIGSYVYYHVAGRWDGSTVQVFVNGLPDGDPVTRTGDKSTTSSPLSVGRLGSYNEYYFDGQITDLFVWARALTAEEIRMLADPSCPDLGGLLFPPRRRLWPVAPVAEYVKRRQLGLRVGSREAIT